MPWNKIMIIPTCEVNILVLLNKRKCWNIQIQKQPLMADITKTVLVKNNPLHSGWSLEHYNDVNPRFFFSFSNWEHDSVNHCWFDKSDEWGKLLTTTSESVMKKMRNLKRKKRKRKKSPGTPIHPCTRTAVAWQQSRHQNHSMSALRYYTLQRALNTGHSIQQSSQDTGHSSHHHHQLHSHDWVQPLVVWLIQPLTFVSLQQFHTKYYSEIRKKKNVKSTTQPPNHHGFHDILYDFPMTIFIIILESVMFFFPFCLITIISICSPFSIKAKYQ